MKDFTNILKGKRMFFRKGATRQVAYRIAALKRLRVWIKVNEEDILSALKEDLNKAPFEAFATEIGMVTDELRHTLNHIHTWARPKFAMSTIKNFPSHGMRYPQAYGVALIMSPWNYPFMLTLVPLISAVAAGNCVLVKPSVYAKATSNLIARMCREVFAKGHVTVVEGGRAENQALLEQKFDVIFFTGSTQVGRLVMESAAKHLTPVILELGGKSPCIVDSSANLKLAAKRIVWGKFLNSGQTCVAPDYLVVHESVKGDFIYEMIQAIKGLYGDRPLESCDYGKIINQNAFERLIALMKGEKAIAGGSYNKKTMQIEPTLLNDITWYSPIMEEEIFGPILPILTFQSRQEVVKKVNSGPKPLAAYIFTQRKDVARYFVDRLDYGCGSVNDTVVQLSVSSLPFGGVGESGMGSYHGKAGFDSFTHYKSVLHKSKIIDIPLRYPPYKNYAMKIIKSL